MCHYFLLLLPCSQDEECGAAVGSESRLHPPGVFALARRSREQQRPVVVSDALIQHPFNKKISSFTGGTLCFYTLDTVLYCERQTKIKNEFVLELSAQHEKEKEQPHGHNLWYFCAVGSKCFT